LPFLPSRKPYEAQRGSSLCSSPGSTCSPLMFRVLPSMLVVRKLNKRGLRAEPMQVRIHDRCFACDVANDAAGGCYDGCGVRSPSARIGAGHRARITSYIVDSPMQAPAHNSHVALTLPDVSLAAHIPIVRGQGLVRQGLYPQDQLWNLAIGQFGSAADLTQAWARKVSASTLPSFLTSATQPPTHAFRPRQHLMPGSARRLEV
jgi:hypothetical protein